MVLFYISGPPFTGLSNICQDEHMICVCQLDLLSVSFVVFDNLIKQRISIQREKKKERKNPPPRYTLRQTCSPSIAHPIQ
jgi:hypothetical protein